MRTIKFRGLRKDGKGWIYGDLVHNAYNGKNRNVEVGIKQDGEFPIEVIPETVGQFTEMQDSKGVDIYEGDLVNIKLIDAIEDAGYYLCQCEVKMIRGCWIFAERWFNYSSFEDYSLLHAAENELTIIGNIHQKTKP
jgi:uncharacterized phage protein (TIGR01671 family)